MMPDPTATAQWLQAALLAGTRWSETGQNLRTGCSCYGLVRLAYQQAGMVLPATADDAEPLFAPAAPPWQAWDVLQADFTGITLAPTHLALLLALPYGWHCSKAAGGLARFDSRDRFWRRVTKKVWRLQPCA